MIEKAQKHLIKDTQKIRVKDFKKLPTYIIKRLIKEIPPARLREILITGLKHQNKQIDSLRRMVECFEEDLNAPSYEQNTKSQPKEASIEKEIIMPFTRKEIPAPKEVSSPKRLGANTWRERLLTLFEGEVPMLLDDLYHLYMEKYGRVKKTNLMTQIHCYSHKWQLIKAVKLAGWEFSALNYYCLQEWVDERGNLRQEYVDRLHRK